MEGLANADRDNLVYNVLTFKEIIFSRTDSIL